MGHLVRRPRDDHRQVAGYPGDLQRDEHKPPDGQLVRGSDEGHDDQEERGVSVAKEQCLVLVLRAEPEDRAEGVQKQAEAHGGSQDHFHPLRAHESPGPSHTQKAQDGEAEERCHQPQDRHLHDTGVEDVTGGSWLPLPPIPVDQVRKEADQAGKKEGCGTISRIHDHLLSVALREARLLRWLGEAQRQAPQADLRPAPL
mmetsp:Transcript_100679/g.285294  ORF Transcript_100679/g.285294 Transcript_100679/m.285294 type:complete len:200 (-) Transcript_100679:25-624(-)